MVFKMMLGRAGSWWIAAAAVVALSAPVSKAETITGHIYCDNQFEFYFNGQLVKADPMSFTPHQAVAVSFEYDGTSDKTYAIMCQDYASDSGYEYIDTNSPQLGDGALIAKFSDGTVTSSAWAAYTATYGPTEASEAAGCSSSNLAACEVEDRGTPTGWYASGFDDSAWTAATVYSAAQAGWGRTPSWSNGECCDVTSPLTRSTVGCSVDPASGAAIAVTEDECLDPKDVLNGVGAEFLWGASLTKDNKMLFRLTVPGAGSTPTDSTTTDSTPAPTTADSAAAPTASDYSDSPADSGATPSVTLPRALAFVISLIAGALHVAL